ncbi:MAG: hypothetical protein R3F44_01290 [Candidatus Competibacteraceae bacterium]
MLLLLFLLLTMRLLSEERRTGTLDLLLSAPVGSVAIAFGKYLGVMLFLSGIDRAGHANAVDAGDWRTCWISASCWLVCWV